MNEAPSIRLHYHRPFRREWITVPVMAVMLIGLQFQTLPVRIQVQVLPLTTVLALFVAPLMLRVGYRTPLFTVTMAFTSFAVLHSSVALVIDLLSQAPSVRFLAWARQTVGLVAGVIAYMVFRQGLLSVDDRRMFRWITIGFLPALVISALNILWGAGGMGWAGDIVLGVREVLAPEGYNSPFRTSGLSNEPAGWATSLVLTVFPAVLFMFATAKKRRWPLLFLLAAVVSFVWTFSTIGLLLVIAVLFTGIFTGPRRAAMVGIFFGFLFLMGSALVLFPNNQVLRHATVLLRGQTNISFNDRYYAVVSPFENVASSLTSVGYGLGGVSSHFQDIMPKDVQSEIIQGQWEGLPNLTIMAGRIFAETGAIGFVLFLTILAVATRQVLNIRRHSATSIDRNVADIMRLGWIAVVVSLFISIGPYQTPFLWLYLAWIDARWISGFPTSGRSSVDHSFVG